MHLNFSSDAVFMRTELLDSFFGSIFLANFFQPPQKIGTSESKIVES